MCGGALKGLQGLRYSGGMAQATTIRVHHTATSDGPWNGSHAEAELKEAGPQVLRRAYAWEDPGGDPHNKSSYKFIHHEVDRSGKAGAANVRACISGIAVLNGGRGGADIPASDRKSIYSHLARHLRDAGHEPAPLK